MLNKPTSGAYLFCVCGCGFVNWRRFFDENVGDSDILCTCLAHIGQHYTDRITYISVMSSMVAKARIVVTSACYCRWHFHTKLRQWKYNLRFECPSEGHCSLLHGDKHSSLFTGGLMTTKKVIYIGPRCKCYKTILNFFLRHWRGHQVSQSVRHW